MMTKLRSRGWFVNTKQEHAAIVGGTRYDKLQIFEHSSIDGHMALRFASDVRNIGHRKLSRVSLMRENTVVFLLGPRFQIKNEIRQRVSQHTA